MNQEVHFLPTYFSDLGKLMEEYRESISIPYDDFLEDHILKSQIYILQKCNDEIGFFGIFGKMITILFVRNEYMSLANAIYVLLKGRFEIQEAFVPTTDLCGLAVFLEHFKSIEVQALHFTDSRKKVRLPEYGREMLSIVTIEDLKEIEKSSGDFIQDLEKRINQNEIFVLKEDGLLLGIGVLVENKIMKDCIGTNMFTIESMRGKGIGRSIILHLKDIVYGMGKTPVPGCWYYNTQSRKTLESAGYITKSKLLRICLL